MSLCRQAGATTYLSGPTARGYMEEALFAEAGIDLVFFDYSGYPEYPSSLRPSGHEVSVLDLLFQRRAARPVAHAERRPTVTLPGTRRPGTIVSAAGGERPD